MPGDTTTSLVLRQGWLLRALVLAFATIAPVQALRPMVSYRALELGADAFFLGLIAGAYAALSFVMSVPLGRWMDRLGPTRFLIGGTSLVAATAVWFALAGGLWSLLAAQAALGLGQVSGLIGLQTLLSNHGATAERDARIGAFTVAVASAQMIGPAASGMLYDAVGGSLASVFWLTAFACLAGVALAVSIWVRPPPAAEGRAAPGVQGSMRHEVGVILRTPSVPHAILASLTVLTTIDLLIAYLPAYGEAVGIPVGTVGLLLSVQAAGTLLSRLLMVRLIRLMGRRNLLVTGMILPAVALVALPTTASPAALFVIIAVAGFGLGLGQPLSLAWVISQVPTTMRGTAIGVRLTANRFGQLALPIGVGAIAGATGIGAIFLAAAAMLGASSAAIARARMTADP